MKKLLAPFFVILVLCGYTTAAAQKDTTLLYFDSLYAKVNKKTATRIGKVVRKNDMWFITVYKISNGAILMTGSYSDHGLETKEGPFEFFDENHTSVKGEFHDGKQEGVWKRWDKDGFLTDSVFFNLGEIVSVAKCQYHVNGHLWRYSLERGINNEKITRVYDSADVLISAGRFVNTDGEMFIYYPSGKVKSHSVFKDGKRTIYDLYEENGPRP